METLSHDISFEPESVVVFVLFNLFIFLHFSLSSLFREYIPA